MVSENVNFLKIYGEKVYSNNFPPPRFGHTVNLVSQTTVLIFGGAISGHVNYTMTADLYLFNMSLNNWKKLERKFIFKLYSYSLYDLFSYVSSCQFWFNSSC